MNQRLESHYVNTGFPTESYIYLFEGFPYNYAEMSSPIMMHDHQETAFRSLHTGSNKFELASPGTLDCDLGQGHVEDGDVPYIVEEPEELDTNVASDSPVEHVRSNSNASSSQVFWQDNIDPDNMTYEELLDLGEAVGTQSRGLSEDLISSLPVSKYKSGGFFWRKKSRGDPCVICQMDYKRGDRQMTLPCKHVYHAKCATQWLSINKACPICFREVSGTDPSR